MQITGGRTWVQYDVCTPIWVSHTRPSAPRRSPTVIGTRGPMRGTRADERPRPATMPDREREEGQTGFEGRVVQHLLEVVAEEDEHGEQTGPGEQGRQVGTAPVAFGHHPQRQQRMAGAGFHHDERDQQDGGHGYQDQRGGGCPTVGVRLGEPVDQADQACGGEDARPGCRTGSFRRPGSRGRSARQPPPPAGRSGR